MKKIVIGIAGGTGSGKSTLAKMLCEKYKGGVSVLSFDNYYKRHDSMPFEERRKINYDSPEALDTSLTAKHIAMLKSGEGIDCPVYDYAIHNRTDETTRIDSSQIIIVDGILALYCEEIRELCDLGIFVDTDADERILRRIERDINERGRKIDDIISQYRTTVRPMHKKFVEPSKKFADMIINGENIDEETVEAVCEKINSIVTTD